MPLSPKPPPIALFSIERVFSANSVRFAACTAAPASTAARAVDSVLPNEAVAPVAAVPAATSVRIVSVFAVVTFSSTSPVATTDEPIRSRTFAVGRELA